jgi:hypothetical protein
MITPKSEVWATLTTCSSTKIQIWAPFNSIREDDRSGMIDCVPAFMQAVDRYNADEGNAMWAVPHFVNFLTKVLTEYNLDKVHLIGHR